MSVVAFIGARVRMRTPPVVASAFPPLLVSFAPFSTSSALCRAHRRRGSSMGLKLPKILQRARRLEESAAYKERKQWSSGVAWLPEAEIQEEVRLRNLKEEALKKERMERKKEAAAAGNNKEKREIKPFWFPPELFTQLDRAVRRRGSWVCTREKGPNEVGRKRKDKRCDFINYAMRSTCRICGESPTVAQVRSIEAIVGVWKCAKRGCGVHNSKELLKCASCASVRPTKVGGTVLISDGAWYCAGCEHLNAASQKVCEHCMAGTPTEQQFQLMQKLGIWTCRECSARNLAQSNRCTECNVGTPTEADLDIIEQNGHWICASCGHHNLKQHRDICIACRLRRKVCQRRPPNYKPRKLKPKHFASKDKLKQHGKGEADAQQLQELEATGGDEAKRAAELAV